MAHKKRKRNRRVRLLYRLYREGKPGGLSIVGIKKRFRISKARAWQLVADIAKEYDSSG